MKILHRYGCGFLCLLLVWILLPISAEAAETKTVRVGWYEGTYNITGANEERSGYTYEYQQVLAAYNGWTYEYTKADWSELMRMLQNGEIDLLGSVSYTDERAGSMLFSELPMGKEKYYLYADLSRSDLSASDLTTLNGKRIAMLENGLPAAQFSAWEDSHGLRTLHVPINSAEDIHRRLASGDIDGFVVNESPQWEKEGFSPIAVVGGSDNYFVVNRERPDLKEALDQAMRQIEFDKPFFQDTLYQRYFSSAYTQTPTREELEWISRHGAIRIGFLDNDAGISVLHPKTGEMTGVITDYVRLAANSLRGQPLEFELRGYDTRAEQLQALQNDEIDLIFHVSQNPYSAETNGFYLSDTVWTFNLAALTARGSFDENAENSIAMTRDHFGLRAYISYCYPQWTLMEYDTMAEVEKAVRDGEADCFVVSSNKVADYLKDRRFNSVFLTKPCNTSFAVRNGNTVLLSILNKTLRAIPTTKLSGAVSMYDSSLKRVTAADFIRDNLPTVALSLSTLLALILLVVLGSLKKSRTAEAKATEAAAQARQLNRRLEESRQELQEALVQAEGANAAKTAFLNNMSHDIRTPINGIMGMLSVIKTCGNDPERTADCLDKIEISSKLLLSLVNDVLDMAKLESGTVILNHEAVDLQQVCSEVMEAVSFQTEKAGLHVTAAHDDYHGIRVWSSAVHLKKVLMNLFTNSIKYNRPGGSIDVSMRTLAQTDMEITCEFRISDTGVGMSRDFIENKLFVPFVQADDSPRSSYMGTGLGMPIVKETVEQMGGSISVESTPGKGSCFTVVIPFRIAPTEETAVQEAPSGANLAGLHLLLAEDNPLNAEIAQILLSGDGAEVTAVGDGQQAVEAFRAHPAGTFDAILMDIMMPVMDGLDATRAIRGLDRPDARTIPIIAITANAFAEDRDRVLAAGMNDHVAKPIDMDVLIRVLREYLG